MQRKIAWFSCGVASAVASKLALDAHRERPNSYELEIVYINVENEHKSRWKFLRACESWYKHEIKIIQDTKYSASVDEVIAKTHYMAGVYGAACTTHLKKNVRRNYQKPDDIHILGMSYDEQHRINRLIDAEPELLLENVLIDNKITKKMCFDIIKDAGIELPAMYQLGYSNGNCIGCVKSGSVSYWNKIRKNFPEVFKLRAEQERLLGVALCKMSLNKFKTKYKKHYETMFKDHKKGLVKWVMSGSSLRIPLRYLPEAEMNIKELALPSCGFVCEAKT